MPSGSGTSAPKISLDVWMLTISTSRHAVVQTVIETKRKRYFLSWQIIQAATYAKDKILLTDGLIEVRGFADSPLLKPSEATKVKRMR